MKNLKEDFFDIVFEKMEDIDAFDMKDVKLTEYKKETSKASENLNQFIEQRIHPNTKKRLMELLKKRDETFAVRDDACRWLDGDEGAGDGCGVRRDARYLYAAIGERLAERFD